MKNKRKIITFYPNGEYYFHKGLKAYETKDLYQSKKYLQRAVRFEPHDPDYLCQLAAVLAELGEYEASNNILEKVVTEIDPDLAECHFFRANNFVHLGLFDEAESEIQRYIAAEPGGPFTREANELLELLQDEEPYPAQPHEKARLMLQEGRYKQAADFLRDIIHEHPEYWEAHNYLALTYFYLHQYKKALTILERVLKKEPGNVHALCNLAVFYRQLDVERRCQEVIEALKSIYPLSSEERCKLGSTFMLLAEYEDAFHWLKSAEKTGIPGGGPFYYWLAVSAYFSGNLKEAERSWRKIRTFDFTKHHPFQYSAVHEMLLEDNVADNPLIRSLVTEVLRNGDKKAKCFALFVLREINDDQAINMLKNVEGDKFEDAVIKAIAGDILLEKAPEQTGQSTTYVYRIVMDFQNNSNNGQLFVEDYTLYWRWFHFRETSHGQYAFHNINAWTAALHYSWKKDAGEKVTQKAIAKHYATSVSTLSSYVRKVKPVFDKNS